MTLTSNIIFFWSGNDSEWSCPLNQLPPPHAGTASWAVCGGTGRQGSKCTTASSTRTTPKFPEKCLWSMSWISWSERWWHQWTVCLFNMSWCSHGQAEVSNDGIGEQCVCSTCPAVVMDKLKWAFSCLLLLDCHYTESPVCKRTVAVFSSSKKRWSERWWHWWTVCLFSMSSCDVLLCMVMMRWRHWSGCWWQLVVK